MSNSVDELLKRIAELLVESNAAAERRHRELLEAIDSVETWLTLINSKD